MIAAASAAFDLIAGLVALGDAFLTIAWLVPYFKREKWTLLKGLVATGIVFAVVLVFVFNLDTRRKLEGVGYSGGGGGLASVAQVPLNSETKEYVDEAARQQNAFAFNAATKAKPEANYQGLPARFEIPNGERHSFFGQELLSTDREHAITVVLVSSTIVWLLGMILVALATLSIWRARDALAAGLRERLATPAAAPCSPPGPRTLSPQAPRGR